MYIYLDKKEAIKGTSLVLGVYNNPIDNFNEYFENNAIEFIGDNLPYHITYDIEKNIIREATKQELYNRGEYSPSENQYIEKGILKDIPSMDKEYINGVFNQKTEKWEEKATNQEQREYFLNKCFEISRKIQEYKSIGFEGRIEIVELENKLQNYKLKYASTFEEEAIILNNQINSIALIK